MRFGITGNPHKDLLWKPVSGLIDWMLHRGVQFSLHPDIAVGLLDRGLIEEGLAGEARTDFEHGCDFLLSFGGDGTLLNTAQALGVERPPILGVNIGRLGFLTGTEADALLDAIGAVLDGRYEVDERTMLQASVDGHDQPLRALNEILVTRVGSAQMISVEVEVDGVFLNRYWADGLIVATATGSTAYSLSVGGPIVVPGSSSIVITPVAPHTLTMRPIVLPDSARLAVRVKTPKVAYTVAADGYGPTLDRKNVPVTIERSPESVRLVKLEGWDYYDTLRRKLSWGAGA